MWFYCCFYYHINCRIFCFIHLIPIFSSFFLVSGEFYQNINLFITNSMGVASSSFWSSLSSFSYIWCVWYFFGSKENIMKKHNVLKSGSYKWFVERERLNLNHLNHYRCIYTENSVHSTMNAVSANWNSPKKVEYKFHQNKWFECLRFIFDELTDFSGGKTWLKTIFFDEIYVGRFRWVRRAYTHIVCLPKVINFRTVMLFVGGQFPF